jgi:hypothetical protein
MRRILMIAYHFPPLRGSSGIQRTLRFARYLPEFGWEPVVLTTSVNAYETSDQRTLRDIPENCRVVRAWALDAARHLSIRGKYVSALARPDRWMSWTFTGTAVAAAMCLRERFDAVWSTYPIASAHVIGNRLTRLTNLPWIADVRDPMAQENYPIDPRTRRMYRDIETAMSQRASLMTFTTPGAVGHYRATFPSTSPERFKLLENGYDAESFHGLEATGPSDGRLVFLHSGVVYPSERDPTHLIKAIARLKRSGTLSESNAVFRFRASGHDAMIARLAADHGVEDLVELREALPYREALSEMLHADVLLLLQAANCNAQIPAKLYEYFRAQRPVLALTDDAGDTAHALRRWGYTTIAPLDCTEDIARLIERFLKESTEPPQHSESELLAYSRRGLTARLAAMLDDVCATKNAA